MVRINVADPDPKDFVAAWIHGALMCSMFADFEVRKHKPDGEKAIFHIETAMEAVRGASGLQRHLDDGYGYQACLPNPLLRKEYVHARQVGGDLLDSYLFGIFTSLQVARWRIRNGESVELIRRGLPIASLLRVSLLIRGDETSMGVIEASGQV